MVSLSFLVAVATVATVAAKQPQAKQPHIVFFLADGELRRSQFSSHVTHKFPHELLSLDLC